MKDTRNYHILIIEDDEEDILITETLLEQEIAAPEITVIHSFKEAQALFSNPDIKFDVILLDLVLPDKNGQDLLFDMLELVHCKIPLIVLTGYSDKAFSIKTISLCIADYLLKNELNAATLYRSIIYTIERQKIMTELRASEKQYSDLFNLSPQPMWLYDTAAHRFKKINKAAIALYGYTESEFLHMGLDDIRADEDLPEKGLTKNIKHHESGIYTGHFIHRKKNGTQIYADVSVAPVLIDNADHVLVVAIDVTEKKQQQQQVTRAIINALEDERYDMGSELHDNVCQILATSLMTVGMLQKMVLPAGDPYISQTKEYINLALTEIRNLSHRLAPAHLKGSTQEEILWS